MQLTNDEPLIEALKQELSERSRRSGRHEEGEVIDE